MSNTKTTKSGGNLGNLHISSHLNNAPGGIHIRGVCCQVCRVCGWVGWILWRISWGEFQDEMFHRFTSTKPISGFEMAIRGYHSHFPEMVVLGTSKELLLTDGNEGSLSCFFFRICLQLACFEIITWLFKTTYLQIFLIHSSNLTNPILFVLKSCLQRYYNVTTVFLHWELH